METTVCKTCGRELPLSQFANNRYGTPLSTCRECVNEKRAQTRYDRINSVGGGGKTAPFSDAAFDGKEPREVIDLMSRAKRWLEARGYSITLKGTYTQVREIKF